MEESLRVLCLGLPHTRGGVSGHPGQALERVSSSPHPWGCFLCLARGKVCLLVFPTPVGVFLRLTPRFRPGNRLPHTRGGVSGHDVTHVPLVASSPHPWGCFRRLRPSLPWSRVFPTPVGVFPTQRLKAPPRCGLPHTRGGVSSVSCCPTGCPYVFPTPVGVFPLADTEHRGCPSLPHTRGGVSRVRAGHWWWCRSSPHPWGCFLLL